MLRSVLTLSFLFFISLPAYAQDRLPSITELNNDEVLDLPLVSRGDDFRSDNLYLEDTLNLQYQISLLERMVERQAGIARLEKNYISLGTNFEQPSPPYGICEQIPANIPCFRAYPELYDVILPEFSALNIVEDMPLTLEMTNVQSSNEITPDVPEEKVSTSDSYLWAEILCGGGICSAVLIQSNNTSFRRTVQEGDVLEDGEFEIVSISSDGVVIENQNGDKTDLLAALAPDQGGPSSPFLEASVPMNSSVNPDAQLVQSILDGNQSTLENNALENDTANIPVPSTDDPIQDPGPPLGPTGLF